MPETFELTESKKENSPKQKCLVVWSGGLDSTKILYDLLNDDTKEVRTFSASQFQVVNSDIQKKHRDLIQKHFEIQGKTFERVEVTLKDDAPVGIPHDLGTQPLMWFSLAFIYLKAEEDLYYGYIKGDDFWHVHEDLQRAFDSFQRVSGKTGSLQYPLEWVPKNEIISFMQEKNLLNLCRWCEERDNISPCGKCNSCFTHDLGIARNAMLKNRGLI